MDEMLQNLRTPGLFLPPITPGPLSPSFQLSLAHPTATTSCVQGPVVPPAPVCPLRANAQRNASKVVSVTVATCLTVTGAWQWRTVAACMTGATSR